ncbi:MAG: hypothetical protein JSR45_14735 [Proteobacteria bacterium]|nr:hypothetical protein [Pseudomonadota bacterium]
MTYTTSKGGLEVGVIVQDTFTTIVRNPVAVGGTLALFAVLPVLAYNFLTVVLKLPVGFYETAAGWTTLAELVAAWLALVVLQGLGCAAMTPAVLASASGNKITLAECLRPTTQVALPVTGAQFISVFGFILGIILLIVPGAMASAAWAVLIPAIATERLGVRAGFSRTLYLTRGHRWAVFGGLFVIGVISALVQIAVRFALKPFYAGATNYWLVGFQSVVEGLSQGLSLICAAVIYAELVRIKSGTVAGQAASVFD